MAAGFRVASPTKYFDEYYGYDGLYRITGFARGQLTGTPPSGVTGQTWGEGWWLDPTGNWNGYTQTTGGTTHAGPDPHRHAVNEITGITNTTGDAWSQPGYDPAGNMISMPQPNSPGDGYAATFDAWHRLRFIFDLSTVRRSRYRRTSTMGGTSASARCMPSGMTTETRDFYPNDSWQVLQEYVSGYVDRQYFWGLRYIDDLVLRDRSAAAPACWTSGMYALQDANWNVVAIYNAGTTRSTSVSPTRPTASASS